MRGLFFLFISSAALSASLVQAAGKPPAPVAVDQRAGKRVVELMPVPPVTIELPDDARAQWGADLDGALVRALQATGRFVVLTPWIQIQAQGSSSVLREDSRQYQWPASQFPAARVRLRVTEMGFRTGDRGGRFFYGFNERIPNLPNDFPLRDTLLEANWMDRTFDAVGIEPINSQAGLDLGDGFSVNAVVAGVRARYARYEASLGVEITIEKFSGQTQIRQVSVQTDGFFVDVAGGYLGYSAGIRLARRDAMIRAMQRAAEGVSQSLEHGLAGLPLTARLDAKMENGDLLLGAGFDAQVPEGTLYASLSQPRCLVKVVRSLTPGVVVLPVSTEPANCEAVALGEIFVETTDQAPAISSLGIQVSSQNSSSGAFQEISEQIRLPALDYSASPGLRELLPAFDPLDILRFFALPVRIARYFMYDQERATWPARRTGRLDPEQPDPHAAPIAQGWAGVFSNPPRSVQFGGKGVTVALIDSGVDYNHPVLFSQIAGIHPNGKDVGFDAIAGDDRAYDDGYHGTEVASAIVSVAPQVRVLPIKAFNPWGVTRTAALVAAVRYAVQSGAEILCLPWATRRESTALREALREASDLGLVIVTAAGDRGENLEKVPAFPAAWRAELGEALLVVGGGAVGGGLGGPGTYAQALTAEWGRRSNFSNTWVDLIAPGQSIAVARPRVDRAWVTHTGVSAGFAAGVLARELQWGRAHGDHSIRAARGRVLEAAAVVPGLRDSVAGGRSLRVRTELLR